MAEASGTKQATFEDVIFVLFAMLLVGNAIARIPILIQEQLGLDVGSPYLSASVALSSDTPLGTPVATPEGTPYYAEPVVRDEPKGAFVRGTPLTLAGGPKEQPLSTDQLWFVKDENGNSGWVPQSVLIREGVGGVKTPLEQGVQIQSAMAVSVWDPLDADTAVALMAKGERGTLTRGPEVYEGSEWWFVDRADSREDGWVTRSVLLRASDSNNWHIGTRVVAEDDTDLFERAGGGRAAGFIREDEKAHIVGGPLLEKATYWWIIQLEDGTQGWVSERVLREGGVKGWFRGLAAVLLFVGTILMVGLLGGLLYTVIRTNQIRAREAKRIREAVPKKMQPKRNQRWDTIVTHVRSDNPNDWRLAIIEADVMLDELITRLGYAGTTLGERLKQIARGDMKTLDAAWEAHRVRNEIAHAGSDFVLTKREAQRIINLYGAVFEEFTYL